MKKITKYGILTLALLALLISIISIVVINNTSDPDSDPDPDPDANASLTITTDNYDLDDPNVTTQTIGYMGIVSTDEPVGHYDDYNVIEYEGKNYKIWMEEPDYEK